MNLYRAPRSDISCAEKIAPGSLIYISEIVQSKNSHSKFGKVKSYITPKGDIVRPPKVEICMDTGCQQEYAEWYVSLASNNLAMCSTEMASAHPATKNKYDGTYTSTSTTNKYRYNF